jgi:hypothetical protein
VPKICQKYIKISKDIEKDRKGKGLEKALPTEEMLYFLRFTFGRCHLYTVEVMASNSLSAVSLSPII